jgi:hypothetical protein
MKSSGTIFGGNYSGQLYSIVGPASFPRWYLVRLLDYEGKRAMREIRECFLESE